MNRVLIYQADPAASKRLQSEMKTHGWWLDVCEGTLELLRLIEKNEYNAVVLNANHLNVEIYALLGAIEALERSPRIFLNFPQSGNVPSPPLLTLEYPVIEGTLTSEKLLKAAQETWRGGKDTARRMPLS